MKSQLHRDPATSVGPDNGWSVSSSLAHQIGAESIGGDELTEVRDAPDQVPLYSLPVSGRELVRPAAEIASSFAETWRRIPDGELATALLRGALNLEAMADVLAELLIRETGKPRLQATQEVAGAVRTLKQFAHLAGAPRGGRIVDTHSGAVWGFSVQEPAGVVALVTPWNLPVQILVQSRNSVPRSLPGVV